MKEFGRTTVGVCRAWSGRGTMGVVGSVIRSWTGGAMSGQCFTLEVVRSAVVPALRASRCSAP